MVHSLFINRFQKSSKYQHFEILRKRNGTFFVYKSFPKILKISIILKFLEREMVRNFERNGTFFVYKSFQNINILKFFRKTAILRGMVHFSFINHFQKSSKYQHFKVFRKRNNAQFREVHSWYILRL